MALPNSGPITMAMIAAEIGISASGLSLNDSRVRQLAGKPSGAISFADLLGKAWAYLNSINCDAVSYNGGESMLLRLLSVDSNTSWTATCFLRAANSAAIRSRGSNQWELHPTRYDYNCWGDATIRVTGAGKTIDWNFPRYYVASWSVSCFTADCLVLMADGSLKRIDSIVEGDFVRTAVGVSRVSGIDKPVLGKRTLYSFKGGMKTSGEHSIWSRDATGKQWWATHDMEQWRHEAESGYGPSFDQLPYDLTGGNVVWEYATVDGWSKEAALPVPAAPDTQLYHLLLDTGGSYFVNGYLVSSMADSGGVDWHNFTVE